MPSDASATAVQESRIQHLRPASPSTRDWALLAAGFLAVHIVLSLINLYDRVHYPFGDVVGVYLFWMDYARTTGVVVGLDTTWVYPLGALVPMALPYLFGSALYGVAWLVMVAALNAVALVALARRRLGLAWWWLAFLVCLGPVAVARIDAVSAPLAVLAVLLIARHPVVAGALLTAAAWIKVWPAALVAAAVIALRSRVRVVIGAAITTLVVAVAALALGGVGGLFSFITQQTGRGLQIEAPVSLWWMASAALRSGARAYYDTEILTWQVRGPGTQVVADLMTPLLLVVVLGIVAAGVVALRRGADRLFLFADLSLALVLAFIVVNKVGSPQFMGWLAAPVLLLLLLRGRREWVVAGTVLVAAVITQVIYPWEYGAFTSAQPWAVALLGLRHLALLSLLAVAIARVVTARGSTPALSKES